MSWSISFQVENGKISNPNLSSKVADGYYTLSGHDDENNSSLSLSVSTKK